MTMGRHLVKAKLARRRRARRSPEVRELVARRALSAALVAFREAERERRVWDALFGRGTDRVSLWDDPEAGDTQADATGA